MILGLVTIFLTTCSRENKTLDSVEIIQCAENGLWENVEFKIEKVLEITDTLNNEFIFPASYLLKDITTNSKGDIYISNNKDKFIYKFSSSGQLLKKIGREGKGPGEFLYISTLAMDKKDNLFTIDAKQKRLIIFDEHDEAGEHLVIKSIPNSIGGKVLFVPRKNNMMLYGYSDDPNAMITLIDYDGNICGGIGQYNYIDDKKFEKETSAFSNGSVISFNDTILYADKFYNNRIYLYKNENLQTIIKTKTFNGSPYTVKEVSFAEKDKEWESGKYNFSNSFQNDKCYLGFHKFGTINFYKMKNGNIIHFVNNAKKKEIGFELFDNNFQFLGYFKIFDENSTSYIQIMHKDDDDNFYGKKIDKETWECTIIKFKLKRIVNG